jgi:hypothetical protein
MPASIRPSRFAAALGLLALIPLTPALANQEAAAACAAKLQPEARTIYQATAPQVTAGTNLKVLLKSTTRSLVLGGKIARADARPSAFAAYPCLKQLQ